MPIPALLPILSKYKKEAIIGVIFLAMASSMYVMNLKIDNLQLQVENAEIVLAVEKSSHLDCKLKVGDQNAEIIALKKASDVQAEKSAEAAAKAGAIASSLQAEIDKIKKEGKVKSCADGMERLRNSL